MFNSYGYKIYDSIYPQMKIIETDKFILRPAKLSDANDLFEYYSQDKVLKYLPIKTHSSLSETKVFIRNFFINTYKKGNIGHYAIFYKPDEKVIGNIGLNNVSEYSREAEIGICLNPKYWGHDFATELTINSLICGFEFLNLEKLIAVTYQANKYTPKSLESLGFEYVSTKNSIYNIPCHRFELLREDYYNLKDSYLPNLLKKY